VQPPEHTLFGDLLSAIRPGHRPRLLFAALHAVEQALSLLGRSVLVDDGAQGPGLSHGVLVLPDVAAEIYTDGPFLHSIMDKLEYLEICLTFGTACHDHGDGAPRGDLIEVFTPIGLHNPRAQFGSDAAAQGHSSHSFTRLDKFNSVSCS